MMDDTPAVARFKDALAALCKEHKLMLGVTVRHEIGIWPLSAQYGRFEELGDVYEAVDLTTQERIDVYKNGK